MMKSLICQGALLIGELDAIDLSNLDAIIAQAEQSDVSIIEIDITR